MDAIELYDDPSVYDVLNTPGTAEEVRGLEKMRRRWGCARTAAPVAAATRRAVAPSTWLEPACGTGRYLRLAARRRHRVLGIDRSAPMVEYALRRMKSLGLARRADLRTGDMTRLPLEWRGRVDFAFCLVNTIRHLPGDRDVLAHFREIARVLRPRAVYCVGITLTTYGVEFPSEDVWDGRRGPVRVKQVIQYVPPVTPADERARAERVYSHLIVTRGRRVEHRDSRYILRTYSRRQWESLIARSPLRVKAVVDEQGVPLHLSPSGYGVWVLGKR